MREKVAGDPELKALLASDKLNNEQTRQIVQSITNQVMSELGYMPADSTTIFTDEKGQGGADIKGFYSTETKKSYINVKNIADIKELVTTTGVESQRAMDDSDGFGVAEFKPTENELDYHNRVVKALQTTDNSLYASNFGASVGRYYDYALSSAGTSYGKAKVNDVNIAKANSVSGLNFYTQSNAEFSNLDKEQGANNPLITGAIAAAIVAGKVIWKVASKASSKIFTNSGKNLLKKETREKVNNVLEQITKNKGTPPQGYKGGKIYENNPKPGAQKLPENLTYREYDVNPYVKGVKRGSERIVIGSDGSVWYTNNHYQSFIRLK